MGVDTAAAKVIPQEMKSPLSVEAPGTLKVPEKDLNKEFTEKAKTGSALVSVAKNRFEGPYSNPLLNPSEYPQEDIDHVLLKKDIYNQEDIDAARESSLVIGLISAVQITEARPRSGGVREDLDSISSVCENMRTVGAEAMTLQAANPDMLLRATRKALEVKKMRAPDKPEEAFELSRQYSSRSLSRASAIRQAVYDYLH